MCTAKGLHDMISAMTKEQPTVSRNPDVMGGTAVFHGTRVPVQTLLDYLEAGESIDDFLEGFRQGRGGMSSHFWKKRRTGLLKRRRESFPRRMRQLAARPRHRRSRRQNRASDGLDNDQERRAAGACLRSFRRLC